MVTTRMTDALPITMPSPVRNERAGLARSSLTLNRRASPRCIAGLAAGNLLEELLRLGARRVIGCQAGGKIAFEQRLRRLEIPFIPDVGFSSREQKLRTVRRDLFGLLEALIAFLIAALFGQKLCQIDDAPDLLRRQRHGAAQLLLGSAKLF